MQIEGDALVDAVEERSDLPALLHLVLLARHIAAERELVDTFPLAHESVADRGWERWVFLGSGVVGKIIEMLVQVAENHCSVMFGRSMSWALRVLFDLV